MTSWRVAFTGYSCSWPPNGSTLGRSNEFLKHLSVAKVPGFDVDMIFEFHVNLVQSQWYFECSQHDVVV